MVIDETTTGQEIAAFNQNDMSDDLRGPGVDTLKHNLEQYKKNIAWK